MKSRDTLVRLKQFQVDDKRRRIAQLQTMIAEFTRMTNDLDREIGTEERRANNTDPSHFAYPTYARAARARRDNLKSFAQRPSREARGRAGAAEGGQRGTRQGAEPGVSRPRRRTHGQRRRRTSCRRFVGSFPPRMRARRPPIRARGLATPASSQTLRFRREFFARAPRLATPSRRGRETGRAHRKNSFYASLNLRACKVATASTPMPTAWCPSASNICGVPIQSPPIITRVATPRATCKTT